MLKELEFLRVIKDLRKSSNHKIIKRSFPRKNNSKSSFCYSKQHLQVVKV